MTENNIQSEIEAAIEQGRQRSMLPPSLREDDAHQYLSAMGTLQKFTTMIQQPVALLPDLAFALCGDAAPLAQRSEMMARLARTWAGRQGLAQAARWKIAPADRPDVLGANVLYWKEGEQRDLTDPCLIFQRISPDSIMFVAGKREAYALLYIPSPSLEPENIGSDEYPIWVPTHRRSLNERTGEVTLWPSWENEVAYRGVAAYFGSPQQAALALASGQNALATLTRLAREARLREMEVRDPIREVSFGPSDREYEAAARPAPREQDVC